MELWEAFQTKIFTCACRMCQAWKNVRARFLIFRKKNTFRQQGRFAHAARSGYGCGLEPGVSCNIFMVVKTLKSIEEIMYSWTPYILGHSTTLVSRARPSYPKREKGSGESCVRELFWRPYLGALPLQAHNKIIEVHRLYTRPHCPTAYYTCCCMWSCTRTHARLGKHCINH